MRCLKKMLNFFLPASYYNESLFLPELAAEIKKAGIMLDILIQSLLRP